MRLGITFVSVIISRYLYRTKTSASTATRELKDMVDKFIRIKLGVLKSTRYKLNIKHKKTQNIKVK
jgi:hypothetical protein